MTNRTIILHSRPNGPLRATNFAVIDAPVPVAGEGQVVVRNLYGSLDPGTRKLLGQPDGYIEPIPVGSPMTCLVLGSVIESRNDQFPVGSVLVGTGALQEFSTVTPGPMSWIIDPGLSSDLSNHMSVLGSAGLTAYFGMLDAGQPQPGETVLVSAAAGAVGSLAGQIAKIKGCKVVGIAGGSEKCARLTSEFGFDAAIDYRGRNALELAEAIGVAAPGGIDVYFENVGGEHLDAALECMNWSGRIAACGMISEYDGGQGTAFRNLFRIVGKILTIKGFLLFTYADRFQAATAELAGWVEDGKLKFREQIEDGLDNAVPGFLRLFDGSNEGKSMVKIADL